MQNGLRAGADLVHALTEIDVTLSGHDPSAPPHFVPALGDGEEDHSSASPFLLMVSAAQNRPIYRRAHRGALISVSLGCGLLLTAEEWTGIENTFRCW